MQVIRLLGTLVLGLFEPQSVLWISLSFFFSGWHCPLSWFVTLTFWYFGAVVRAARGHAFGLTRAEIVSWISTFVCLLVLWLEGIFWKQCEQRVENEWVLSEKPQSCLPTIGIMWKGDLELQCECWKVESRYVMLTSFKVHPAVLTIGKNVDRQPRDTETRHGLSHPLKNASPVYHS